MMVYLERIAPLAKAAAWDPVGLQFGDPAGPAERIGICHEVTTAVIDRAVDAGLDLLVAYHPLLFRPTTRLVAGPAASGRAYRLIGAGIALAVVHTAYDVAPGGAADALAEALDLGDVAPFGPNWTSEVVKIVTFVPEDAVAAVTGAMSAAGGGVIGSYKSCSYRSTGMGTFFAPRDATPAAGSPGVLNDEPEARLEMIATASAKDNVVAALVQAHPYEEPAYDVYEISANAGFLGRIGALPAPTTLEAFGAHVAERLGALPRIAGDRSSTVRHAAVVPGSGSSFIAAARRADVIVTGDVGHHAAREALERGIAVIDPGHAPTERPGVQKLYAAASQLVEDVVDLTGVDVNPWEVMTDE